MDGSPRSPRRHPLDAVKMEAAALVMGIPFYAVVVWLLLTGWAELGALAVYGVVAGGWIVGRTHRARRQPPPG